MTLGRFWDNFGTIMTQLLTHMVSVPLPCGQHIWLFFNLRTLQNCKLRIIVFVVHNPMGAMLPLIVWSNKLILLVHWVFVNFHDLIGLPIFLFLLAGDVDADSHNEEQDDRENPSTSGERQNNILGRIYKILLKYKRL